MNCDHFLKYRYRLTSKTLLPQLEVQALCRICGAAGPWKTIKPNRLDHDIKKQRALDAFWSEQKEKKNDE